MTSTRSRIACLALLCQALLLVCPVWAQQTVAPLTDAQLTALLERVGANSERYTRTFKDLRAEEGRHFELFASDGKLDKQHRLLPKAKKDVPITMYRTVKVSSECGDFRRFHTEGK